MVALPLLLTLAAAPVVHTHTAGESAFLANAYLVEGEHGVVAIDAPFTNSEAKAFRAELEALHKPLLAVLVTHAHPDHVNGITALVAGQKVPVVALPGVLETLKQIDGPKRAYWSPIYKDEYPASTTFPDQIIKPGEAVTFDGMSFRALDLGAGESADETVWVLEGKEKVAFVGDLVMSRVHPWLAEGRSAAWIASLEKAQKELKGAKRIYPGHGEAGSTELLSWQKKYLEAYRAEVKALAQGQGKLDDAGKAQLAARMEKVLPKGKLGMLVGMSADPVAAELAASK